MFFNFNNNSNTNTNNNSNNNNSNTNTNTNKNSNSNSDINRLKSRHDNILFKIQNKKMNKITNTISNTISNTLDNKINKLIILTTSHTIIIAEDILEINDISFCVDGGDYYDESNNLIKKRYYLNYNSIFNYNIAATKDLDTIVQSQQTEINDLKTEINDLKTELANIKSYLNI